MTDQDILQYIDSIKDESLYKNKSLKLVDHPYTNFSRNQNQKKFEEIEQILETRIGKIMCSSIDNSKFFL
jgi:hypothetical protein